MKYSKKQFTKSKIWKTISKIKKEEINKVISKSKKIKFQYIK